MNYKDRIGHATTAGVLEMVKDRWQNPTGKGRARTYRLSVPVVPDADCTLDYDDALELLTGPDEVDLRGDQTITLAPSTEQPRPQHETRQTDHEPDHDRDRNPPLNQPNDGPAPDASSDAERDACPNPGSDEATVRPEGAGADLEPGPRERDP